MCASRVERLASALSWGLVLEPLAHPKPGAVTRIHPHPDKDVYLFMASARAGLEACVEAARPPCGGFFARGLRSYMEGSRRLGVATNTQLGSVVLLLPLCAASTVSTSLSSLAASASTLLRSCTGEEDAEAYYRALEAAVPSHLGRYEGPVPGVGSGEYPSSLVAAFEAAAWDLVHREALGGYPATLRAAEVILDRGGPFREEALLAALLHVLVSEGDTLIAAKYGWAAYKRALLEARAAAALYPDDPAGALAWLDGLWRPRGWSPGAALDVVAAAAGLAVAALEGLLWRG